MKKAVKPKLHISRKSSEANFLRPKTRLDGYVISPAPTKSVSFKPREPEPGEALPRTHNTLRDPGTYHTDPMVAARPHSEDFLEIKSLGAST